MPDEMSSARQGKVVKAKRSRVNFTGAQLETFEAVFAKSQYPDVAVLEKLSDGMDLGIEKICTWFQNRRSKFRRSSKKGHIDWMRQHIMTAGTQKDEANLAVPVDPPAPVTQQQKTTPSVLSSIKAPPKCYPHSLEFMESGLRMPASFSCSRTDQISPSHPPITISPTYMPRANDPAFSPGYPTPITPSSNISPSGSQHQSPPPPPHHMSYGSAPNYSDGNFQLPTWTSPYPPVPPPSQSPASSYPYAQEYNYPSFNFMSMPPPPSAPHPSHGQAPNYPGVQMSSGQDSPYHYRVNAPLVSSLGSDPLWTTNL